MASLAITAIGVSSAAVNLDDDEPDDYIVLGDGAFGTTNPAPYTRKSGGGSLITITAHGSTPNLRSYNDSPRLISATGGDPVATVTDWSSGVFDGMNFGGANATGGGYDVSVPASTMMRRLRVYPSQFASVLTVAASLSDASASPVSDTTTFNTGGSQSGYIEVEYEAGSNGQTLLLEVYTTSVSNSFGNCAVNAATLKSIGLADVVCDLSVTDSADTVASESGVHVSAALAATDAADTLSSAAAVAVSASIAATDAADTLASTAIVVLPEVTCTLSLTDAADTLSAYMQTVASDDEQYPLAGLIQAYPLTGVAQTYPLGAN